VGEEVKGTYKFSHSVCQGGFVYIHKSDKNISNKIGLRNYLEAIIIKHGLFDVNIRIYDNVFFLFFAMKPSMSPNQIIETIQKQLSKFGEFDSEFIFNGCSDISEEFIVKELDNWGFKE
jgi:hypothetical protein